MADQDFEEIPVTSHGFTLSRLLWRHYKQRIRGSVEACLKLNPGLSATLTIPVGTRVKVPLISAGQQAVEEERVTPTRWFD
ncbi:tail protein X [Pseudovibrio denitrificans]|uniref:tail protein X n=1 Tax=Pseudovibrio denitrificans TaxID=258256 RepID=UPI0039BF9D15